MEYIQTVLVQVEASRLERASEPGGLLAELDAHRDFLRQQPGFRDLRITRSINPEGNVLLVIETRWSDDESLVRYETNEPNVAGIINKHQDVIVRDTLQVLDMEALRTESSFARAEAQTSAYTRTALPLLMPVGILAFALLFIYGLSRVYLEIGGDGAVALAAGLAITGLLVAAYFASNTRAPGWQIGGVVILAAALLGGGAIWAVAEEDESTAEGPAVEEPGGKEPGGGEPSPPGGGANSITLGDNFFEFQGQQKPTIQVTAGEETVFDLTNEGSAIHNMHVAVTGEYRSDFCAPTPNDDPCSDPAQIRKGGNGSITINIAEPGTYDFQCDFHKGVMTGTLEVQ
ncbi:MAG TPA: cupredoxin domain-containing protein [Dehalococcoidia bacterium]|jgi:plastocyanin|nr:cupredoxin domain-containing protein [Dehalococcoidia bacterium]